MIAPARQVSYRILLQIATTDAHSDELLRSAEVDRLSAVDRNLTTTLVMGTLRWQLGLDAQIRKLLARPEAQLSAEAATALRMGAYQLLHLERVPAHAVLHDSVELVKQSRESGAAGMVNAVLRKVQRTADSGQRTGQRTADSGQRTGMRTGPQRSVRAGRAGAALAERWAHPVWMVERWARRYGVEAAEAICRWDQEPAGVTLRLAESDATVEGIESEPGFFLSCARRLVRGDVGRSEAHGPPALRVQDEGSQLVAEIAAAAAGSVRKVLDTCAAPGGKTAILMERLPEAEITAMDVSRKRLENMRRGLAARGRDALGSGQTSGGGAAEDGLQWQVADAGKMDLKPEWDLILCDVPCSGTGTMARNPEIRLRVTEADLQRQQARQVAIFRAGLKGLKPGGRLLYSTCSLEPEENERVVEVALRDSSEARVVPVSGILDLLAERGIVTAEGRERLRTATDGDFLRTLPGVHPCDGFFAAVVEREQLGAGGGEPVASSEPVR